MIWSFWSAAGVSAAGVEDRAGARCGLHVLHDLAVVHLALAAFAAQLAHRLRVQRPALHIGTRQMAAVGTDRQIAAEPQRATFDKAPRLAARTKPLPD
jgi:hypothetical protein